MQTGEIRAALAAWDVPGRVRLEPLGGGRNSETWRVVCPAGAFVAKLAPVDAGAVEAGLAVAEYLGRAGLLTGAPVRTRDGRLAAPITLAGGGQALALLRFVAGRPLDPARPADLWRWGETMGRAHALLRTLPASDVPAGLACWPWAWLDPDASHLERAPWLRPAVERPRPRCTPRRRPAR